MALRVPEMCFWPAKTRKSLNFLRCIYVIDLVVKYGSDINEGNWLQLLFFHCIDGYSCRRYCNEFFSVMFQILDWSILVLHFDANMCNWIPKVIWPWMDWFLGFFVGNWLLSLTSYMYGLKTARDAQLLFYFDDIKYFRCSVWGVFWSVL